MRRSSSVGRGKEPGGQGLSPHRLVFALAGAKVENVDVVNLLEALVSAHDVDAAVLNLGQRSACERRAT